MIKRIYSIFYIFLLGLGVLLIQRQVLSLDLGKHGQTFPIKEESILEHIKRKLASMMQTGELDHFNAQIQEQAKQQVERPKPLSHIAHTSTPREYFYDPTYTVTEDIIDHKGNVLHKKGTTINPLTKVSLDGDMLFIDGDDKRQVSWAKELIEKAKTNQSQFKPTVILVNGSPTTLEIEHGERFYFDQKGLITRKLGIKQVPARVIQEGLQLKISEVCFE